MKLNLLLMALLVLTITSCSNVSKIQIAENDDAVRIKPEFWNEFKIEPNTGLPRNPSALRGSVIKVTKEVFEDSCETGNVVLRESGEILFLDKSAKGQKNPKYEKIPLSKLDLIGEKTELSLGINWFENFNDPLNPKAIREVKLDSIFVPCGQSRVTESDAINQKENPCGCQDFSLSLACPERTYSWYFAEIRAGKSFYIDRSTALSNPEFRDEWVGEVALGYRFGDRGQWGFGFMYSSGVPLYDQLLGDEVEINRPLALLHGRYMFDEVFCIFPFIYGNFGLSVDKASMDLSVLYFNEDCRRQLEVGGDFNIALPISYGLGFGFDIPLFSFVDLSLDMAYRSISFGQMGVLGIWGNVPQRRQVDMFVLRFGLTF